MRTAGWDIDHRGSFVGWVLLTADAQFHRIPAPDSGSHYILDDFLCRDPASYPTPSCDVTGTEQRAEMQGDYVCHTGKKTKTSCRRIRPTGGV